MHYLSGSTRGGSLAKFFEEFAFLPRTAARHGVELPTTADELQRKMVNIFAKAVRHSPIARDQLKQAIDVHGATHPAFADLQLTPAS